MSIKSKLTIAFTVLAMGPLLVMGVFSYMSAQAALTESILEKLGLVADLQEERIEEILLRDEETRDIEIITLVSTFDGLGESGEMLLAQRDENGDAAFLHTRRYENEDTTLSVVPKERTDIPITQALLQNEGTFDDVVDYRGEPILAATRYVESADLGIVVKVDKKEAYAGVTSLGVTSLVFGIFIAFLAALLGYFISLPLSRPIGQLTEIANQISQGCLDIPFPQSLTKKGAEIGVLSKTMETMLNNIKGSRAELEQKVNERTEELRQEKSMTEKHAQDLEKFKLAMDSTSEQIVITDSEGMVLYANKATTQLTGYTVEESMGVKAGKLWGGLMPKAYYENMWYVIKEQKQTFVGELTNHRKDGSQYIVLINISPILNAEGEVVFFVSVERDITKEKQIDQMKTEFISLASHQLRTPLSAINWITEMLLEGDSGELTDAQKAQVDDIRKSNTRMVELVNALLNISRIESGRIMINPEPTDLGQLLAEIIDEFEPMLNQKQMKVVVSVNEKIGQINLDKQLIGEVYKNFISNAIKYSGDGSEINVFVSAKENEVISQIADTGYGIPQKEQNRVFDKFFRAENVLNVDTDGTGLGLYLVKSIVESSRGRVWFESEENKGSAFFFSLPKEGMTKKEGDVTISK